MALMIVINGITLAALYFIMAIGLNLSFGLLRVVNMTHGAFYLLGGYIGLTFIAITKNWMVGLLAAGIVIAALAFLDEFFLLRRVRGNSTLETLMTLSITIIISDLVLVFWGGDPKNIAIPSLLKGYIMILNATLPVYNIFVFLIAVVIGVVFTLILKQTKAGMIIRAGVDNFEITSTLGINIRMVFTLVFCISGFMAGIAGVIGGTFMTLSPGQDWTILTYTLLVIIIGGMGSFTGTIVGSIIIGFILSIGNVYMPQFSLFLMFAPVAVILVVKPKGLFGRAS